MNPGIAQLSDREKETLRLLLAGHDAKSIAQKLDLSVHTINDRLREARRKLGVTSSREAARFLGEAEQSAPEFLGGKEIGADAPQSDAAHIAASQTPQNEASPNKGQCLFWLAGGMLIMSLLVAAAVFMYTLGSGDAAAPEPIASSASIPVEDAQKVEAAEAWLAIVDKGEWKKSWQEAADYFRSRVTEPQWENTMSGLNQQLGAVQTRKLQSVTKEGPRPGGPAGDHYIIQFKTDFTNKPGSVETVVLTEKAKVVGYFVR